jgi:hypothetical protein
MERREVILKSKSFQERVKVDHAAVCFRTTTMMKMKMILTNTMKKN